MSDRVPVGENRRPNARSARVRAYLRRFFTCWVAEDPDPAYSALDRSDGLAQVPDPVCTPRVQVPESWEVAAHISSAHISSADRSRSTVGGRAGL